MDSSSIDAKLLVLPFSKSRPSKTFSKSDSQFEGGSDEWLLSCVQAGESEALACLFRRHADQIRGLGRRILRDSGEAEDLVQEVFIYVYRKCGSYQHSKGGARSWIFQIAYTQALIRRRQLKSRGVYSSGTPETGSRSHGQDSFGPKYDDTVEGLFGRSRWKEVWDSLTEYQRETLSLHFYEGCTFTEIAERLGQSYVNIRHHYYRALEKLRKHADDNDLNWP